METPESSTGTDFQSTPNIIEPTRNDGGSNLIDFDPESMPLDDSIDDYKTKWSNSDSLSLILNKIATLDISWRQKYGYRQASDNDLYEG